MSNTTLATASQVQKWDSRYFAEYVRNSGFLPYISRGAMSPICAKYELTAGGKYINIPLVTRLTGSGVTGTAALEGNEEALGNFSHQVQIDWLRNGVAIPKPEQHWTEMDLRRAAREQLQMWSMSKLRDEIISALGSIDGTAYASASEAGKDAWLAANADRVLFGAAKSNNSANDHSASLANIDSTNDKLDAGIVSLAKRMAKVADPHIRPVRTNDGSGREYYVMFANSFAFRDLKEDSTIATANREARPRDVEKNPIFQDGDLIYDGVIVREIPEIGVISGVGASSIDVAPCYLCGAQALAIAWGQEPRSTTDTRDYGFIRGVGIEEARGVDKLVYNGVQHGLLTLYVSGEADS